MVDRETMARLARAHAAHDAQDWAGAARLYRDYLEGGGDRSALVAFGDVLTELGRHVAAAQAYGHAVQAGIDMPRAAARLASAQAVTGEHAAAREMLRWAYLDGHVPTEPEAPLAHPPPSAVLRELNAYGWLAGGPPANSELQADAETVRLVEPPPPIRAVRLVSVVGPIKRADEWPAWAPALLAAEQAQSGRHLTILLAVPDLTLEQNGATFLHLEAAPDTPRLSLLNVAVAIARQAGADLLLLEGAPPDPGSLGATLAEPADPMTGFVSLPRGNEPSLGGSKPPSALLIRARILSEFERLDAAYESADAAQIDLMARANRAGFIASPTGFAEATSRWRVGDTDRRLLKARYPELERAAAQAASRAPARAARLVKGLETRPARLLLDISNLATHHDGISEVETAVALAFHDSGRFDIHLLCSPEAARFHGLDALVNAGRVVAEPEAGDYAACLRLCQPLTAEDVERTLAAAPVAGFLMHDPIAYDVARLNTDDLADVWSHALQHAELVGYVSAYAASQFERRFEIRDRPGRFVTLNSTSAQEYRSVEEDVSPASAADGVLVVGNGFAHKNMEPTVARIRSAFPDLPLDVLGLVRSPAPRVRWFRSGSLSPAEVAALYARASVVVYPSFYEGFGLPIMHGLARGRRVLAIDQPCYREIRDRSRVGANLHLFPTTDALVAALPEIIRRPFEPPSDGVVEHRWEDTARDIGDAVDRAMATFDRGCLTARLSVRPPAPASAGGPADGARNAATQVPLGRLDAGRTLQAGEHLVSTEGRMILHMQPDGNLVLYRNEPSGAARPIWAAGTEGRGARLTMEPHGRLSLTTEAAVVWAVETGSPGAYLEVSEDGLTITNGARPMWAHQDTLPPLERVAPPFRREEYGHAAGLLASGSELIAPCSISSRNGEFTFEVLRAEEMRLLGPGPDRRVLWAAPLAEGASRLIMQRDGNLVVYGRERALWASGTPDHPGAHFELRDDGSAGVVASGEWVRVLSGPAAP